MGRYLTDNKSFCGYIMAEFKFNIFTVFSQHFKVHDSAILSFRPNGIVIQTMRDNNKNDYSDNKGFYTTTIPVESLGEYEFNCNICEVNVMITKTIINSTSKVCKVCRSISIVSNGFLIINDEVVKSLVEVSFDLCEKRNRDCHEVVNEKHSMSDKIFGKVVRKPY